MIHLQQPVINTTLSPSSKRHSVIVRASIHDNTLDRNGLDSLKKRAVSPFLTVYLYSLPTGACQKFVDMGYSALLRIEEEEHLKLGFSESTVLHKGRNMRTSISAL